MLPVIFTYTLPWVKNVFDVRHRVMLAHHVKVLGAGPDQGRKDAVMMVMTAPAALSIGDSLVVGEQEDILGESLLLSNDVELDIEPEILDILGEDPSHKTKAVEFHSELVKRRSHPP